MLAKIVVLSLPYYIKSEYIYNITNPEGAAVGKRVVLNFNGKKKYGVITEILNNPVSFPVKSVEKVIDEEALITPELFELSKWMSKFYISSLSACLSLILPSANAKGVAKFSGVQKDFQKKDVVFTDEQQNAYEHLKGKLESGNTMSYLWGVTGSGKTNVFLNLARDVVDAGKSVIYLVPEIGLTIQLYSALREYFSEDEVGIIHSGITESKRIALWKKIRAGEIKIIVGTRSGVFAPFDDIGLIIMDEEQDGSYKSDRTPCFSTRHLAWWRAKYNNCALIAGSATPSFEYLKMIRENAIDTVYMKKRIGQYKMPKIINVNAFEISTAISPALEKAMREELDKGMQVILFLNRRGFLYHYKCPECGFELECPHCSVSMTYHREKNLFVCHRCSHTEKTFSACPVCGSKNEMYSGYGTEYVERIAREMFPFSRTLRMDTDTITSPKAAEDIIDKFEKKEADILIGTQMISKGLNFPSVSLVGILNATANTAQGDFRSDEKLFNLLTQVAGRSGRAMAESRVIIQSDDSTQDVIQAIQEDSKDDFYAQQLEIRKRFGYPPYSRFARLVVRSRDEFCANKVAQNTFALATEFIRSAPAAPAAATSAPAEKIKVISYGKCPIYKEKDYYRMQLIVKSEDVKDVIRLSSFIKEKLEYKSNFFLEIDIDPLNIF